MAGRSDPPTYVFAVTGMGGIGKSALLLRMSELVRHYGVREVWIDGRACNRTPRGLIDYLTATDSRSSRRPRCRVLEVFLPVRERTVWFVDDFEELEPLDGWLRERFFGRSRRVGEPPGALVRRRPLRRLAQQSRLEAAGPRLAPGAADPAAVPHVSGRAVA